jgi:MoaA/NifB/PqqE/SkfB family radical SAM enzyme
MNPNGLLAADGTVQPPIPVNPYFSPLSPKNAHQSGSRVSNGRRCGEIRVGMRLRGTRLRRNAKSVWRRVRELAMIARALASTDHPVLAHLVVTRRCNLACAYCSEYDHVSPPVPLEALAARVDQLAALGASIVTISGGEPLLHPRLEGVVARIRQRNMLAGLITNGYLLTAERICALNRAGLDHLQISIDNVRPGPVSKKSLKVLDRKLELLLEHAEFHVNINTVLGSADAEPADALRVARRAHALGFTSTVGLLHDRWGQMKALDPEQRLVFERIQSLGKRSYSRFDRFQDNIARGVQNEWRCRAGARYLYVCEDGLVHYCSQQRGYPGKPLADYTLEDVRREFLTEKPCAGSCTVSCVHKVSYLDGWRAPQRRPAPLVPAPSLVQIESPSDLLLR